MKRVAEKLFRLTDRIAELSRQEQLVSSELEAHQHIHDDATRDAAVSGHYLDAEEAELTSADVGRFERALADLRRRRARLERRWRRLNEKLGDV